MGASTVVTDRRFGSPKATAAAWTGILAGPAAWILQLMLSYPIAQLSCHATYTDQHTMTLHAISIACLIAIAAGAWVASRTLSYTQEDPAPSDAGRRIDRSRFMALLGLASCALFGMLVLFTWVPPFILHDCQ